MNARITRPHRCAAALHRGLLALAGVVCCAGSLAQAAGPAGPASPAAAAARAAATQEASYLLTTSAGDTLIGLGRRYLADPAQWPEVARVNGLKQPNRIAVGTVLRIPLRLMLVEPAAAVITASSGDARVAGTAGETAAAVGQTVPEGAELRTGAGNMTVRLVDGTVLRLRADSRVQIEESNRITRAGVVRSGVQVREGQVEVKARPASAGQPGFRVGTPQGVLGVRGTEFRVQAEAAAATTRSEVLEGAVAASGAAAKPAQLVSAGFGVVVDSTGSVSPPVQLLAAPAVGALPALQERPLVRFSLPALAGAVAYRGQVAADASFDQLLADVRSASPELRLADLPDGDYVLRVRGVDANGLQGQNADHPFRLKARPEPPLPQAPAPRAVVAGDRVVLNWTVNPQARSYRLQLSRSEDFSQPLRDLRGQAGNSLPLEGLAPGSYFWRLASERSDTDQGPFGPVNAFELRAIPPPPPTPRAPQAEVGDQSIRLAWEGAPGQTFDLQLARNLAFTELVLERRVPLPELQLELPGTGRFYVRVRARDADGFIGPFSTPQQIDVPHCLRTALGACVRSDGVPVLTVP